MENSEELREPPDLILSGIVGMGVKLFPTSWNVLNVSENIVYVFLGLLQMYFLVTP